MPASPLAPALTAFCLGLLLAACGGADDETAPRGPQIVSAPLPPEALPGCGAIAEALGDLVAGLAPVDAAGTRQTSPESHGLSCAWRTAGEGALGAIVIVDTQPLTEADMRRANLYVADPRAAAFGGFIAMPEGRFDGAAPLGPVGPQVIIGSVTVTLASNARGAAADVTLDQAVDGALAVHRLLR